MPFNFNDACGEAFDTLKEKLVDALIIQSPNQENPFEIMCDASNYALGAVLSQRINKKSYVICYASKTLDKA